MKALILQAIKKSRTSLSVLILITLSGFYALNYLPKATEPDVDFPGAYVGVGFEGVSPEDSERLLAKPLEDALRTVEGVDTIRSTSRTGYTAIMIQFDQDIDMDQALYDVRVKVDEAKRLLPDDAREPSIREFSTADNPILTVSISSEVLPQRVLVNLTQDLLDVIETHPNVLTAELNGVPEDLIEAIVEKNKLESYGISMNQLYQAVANNNRVIPAGSQDTGKGRFSVNVPSVFASLEDIERLPIKVSGNSVVTLKDVANVSLTYKDRGGYSRINGKQSLSIDITKRLGTNIIDTVAEVKELVLEFSEDFPEGVEVDFVRDDSEFALQMITELQGNVLTSVALVMIVVLAALGFRTSMLVGMAIPFSYLFALLVLLILGKEFNFMVMFGMLLGLGMLIDGAIVVTEYADRKLVEGFDRRDAYTQAVERMFWPVTASVATTLAAFVPLIFWPGVAGKFMRYLPITVFAVLAGSLLYALVFGPTIGSLIGRASQKSVRAIDNLKELESGDPTRISGVTGAYARLLALASRYALVTTALTIFALITSFALFYIRGTGMTFFTENDPMFAQISVRARGNLAADEIYQIVREVEQAVLDVPGIREVNMQTGTSGGSNNPWMGGDRAQDSVGSLFLQFHEQKDRELRGSEIMDLMRQRTSQIPGIVVEVQEMEMGPPVGKDVQIQFSSNHREVLEPVVARVREYLDAEVNGLRDVSDTRALPGIEWTLMVDKAQAALYGADVTLVGIAVQLVTNGLKVGEYRPDGADEAVDIRVRYPDGERGFRALDELTLTTSRGRVPISNFVTRSALPNVDTVQRIDGKIVEYIRANVLPGVLADNKVDEIQAWLDTQVFDSRVNIEFRGANEEQNQSMEFIVNAMIMSVLLMFVLLVTQFNSFYQASLILFAVVMSTAGVLLGLAITGMPFSAILTGVGIVALAGIVVNNNIVLIDTYNRVRREEPGLDYISLIVRTGVHRLRPVCLTAVTTVLGLLPLASNWSIDFVNRTAYYGSSVSSFWVPLAQAIVFGLTFATLLTLVSTPAMLAIPHQLQSVSFRGRPKTRTRGLQAASR